jgi:NTE family protein
VKHATGEKNAESEEPVVLDKPTSKIGLALSGGGFRAAAFHLGVLKRLEEVGLLPHISVVSTVSGGSITGALYALRCAQQGDGAPGSYPVDAVIEEVQDLATCNLRGQALFGSPGRVLRTLGSLVTRRVRRMPLLAEELDRQLFNQASLHSLPDWILINATNLATGKCWKFFSDRAGDYFVGATDRVDKIRVAEAVGASAAYPVLTDPYPFKSRWEYFRADLLDDRWMRPPQGRSGDISPWRRRHGKKEGPLTLPLVDGGVYDNEGLNGLRSEGVDHAIYSSTAGPTDAYNSGWGRDLKRTVEVMHSRLGAVTRQHAHEMTHGVHPGDVRKKAKGIAAEMQAISEEVSAGNAEGLTERLGTWAEQLEEFSAVGHPPRNAQYTRIAPILLRKTTVAENRPASYDPPYNIPPDARGLRVPIVRELARVRTDLDAHAPAVVDLLIAQAYFLTDAHLKIGMRDHLAAITGFDDPLHGITPSWEWAHEVIERANANEKATVQLLKRASEQRLFGRSANQ